MIYCNIIIIIMHCKNLTLIYLISLVKRNRNTNNFPIIVIIELSLCFTIFIILFYFDFNLFIYFLFQLTCTVKETHKTKTYPVIVRLTDINDNAPEFVNAPYETSISEVNRLITNILFRFA